MRTHLLAALTASAFLAACSDGGDSRHAAPADEPNISPPPSDTWTPGVPTTPDQPAGPGVPNTPPDEPNTPPAPPPDEDHRLYGPLIDAERRVLGPDVEHDGVRDEVQVQLANLHGNDPELTVAATHFARAITRSAILGSRGTVPTGAQLAHLKAEAECYWQTANTAGIQVLPAYRFEALVANTSERLAAYLEFSAQASGSAIGAPSDAADPCATAKNVFPG